MDAGCVSPFSGSLDDYPDWLAARRARQGSDNNDDAGPVATLSKKDQRRRGAEARARVAPLRRRLRELEQALNRLADRQRELERALADPDLYADDAKPRLLSLLGEKQTVDRELEVVELEWLETGETLEAAERDEGVP
jgi:ATP-binding cassette subfamily F protein 3